jgi:hypothetical protein
MSMASLYKYLSSMLALRKMNVPDGRMLFQYRLKIAEFEKLQELLSQFINAQQHSFLHFSNQSECAAFILYAAEWWRRKYSGGPWRWDQIYASLSEEIIQFAPNERTQTVERGLHFWRLRPGAVGKKYFGALVVQGGLPLQMIAQGDGPVAGLLIRAIRFAQQFNWDETSLMRFFDENSKSLVQHIREPEIYRLLALIVLTVIGLRRDYALAGLADPVGALNEREPDWQNQFPIALDDGSAGPLLAALIKEVAKEVNRHGGSPFMVSRYLEEIGDNRYRLTSVVRVPNAVPLDELATLCRLSNDELPRYFRFDLMTSERTTLCEARTVLSAGSSIVSLNGRGKLIVGAAAALEHMLVCRSEGIDLHDPVGLPGGASLDDEMPWVFTNRNGVLVLVAVGSCRVPDEKILVALDDGCPLTCLNETSRAIQIGSLELGGRKRAVYEVTGAAQAIFGTDGSVLRFQTKQGVPSPDQLVWHGKRIFYPAKPWTIFLGAPRLYSYSATGEISAVNARNLEWHDMEGNIINDLRSYRGPLVVWLLQDGARSARFRMVVEGANATINLISGPSESTGTVCLRNWNLSDVGTDPEFERVYRRDDNDVMLTVTAPDKPPQYVNIQLLWRKNWPGVTLTVPFPASGGRFIDADGQMLKNGIGIALDKIHGIKINVFDRNPHQAKAYRVDLELRSTGHSSRQSQLNATLRFPIDVQGFGEVRMVDIRSNIESLFCQSDQLDSYVTVSLADRRGCIASVQITRYDCELLRDLTRFALSPATICRFGTAMVESAAMLALPLFSATGEPSCVPYTRTGDDSAYWDVAALGDQMQSWLLYPSPNSAIQFRPVFYRPTGLLTINKSTPSGVTSQCPLATAMTIGDTSVRQEFMSRIIEAMADDVEHPSWQFMERQYRLLGHLNLAMLDVWRILARNQKACLTCLERFPLEIASVLKQRLVKELGTTPIVVPTSDQIGLAAAFSGGQLSNSDERIESKLAPFELVRNATHFSLSPEELSDAEPLEIGDAAMLALPLFGNTEEPIPVNYTSASGKSGYWNVEGLGQQNQSWLLYPSPLSPALFRPIVYRPNVLFQIGKQEHNIDANRCPLGNAMEIGDINTRQQYISHIIEAMAIDLAHPSWKLLERHYRLLGHLPLSALDSWRLLARNPKACITCLSQFPLEVAPVLSRRLSSELGVVWELIPKAAIVDSIATLKAKWKSQLGESATPQILRLMTEPHLKSIVAEIPALATSISLAMFHAELCGPEAVASIEREVSKGIPTLLARQWSGPDCLLQKLLLRGHSDDAQWPTFGITVKAIKELGSFLNETTKAVINLHGAGLVWAPAAASGNQTPTNNPKFDVANLPVICAVWTYFDGAPAWWREGNRLLEVRSIRDFDPVWFEETYKNAITVCVAIERETLRSKQTDKQLIASDKVEIASRHITGPDFSKARRVSK